MRNRTPSFDVTPYVRAFPLLVKNPSLMIAPLLAGVIAVFVSVLGGGVAVGDPVGSVAAGLTGLLIQLIESFAFAVSLIIADAAWRRGGSVPFDPSWQEARLRGRDIIFAAIGYSFVLSIATYFQQLALVLYAVAFFAFIYTIPAAAIGGVPGSAALNRSLELVKANALPTALLAVVSVALLLFGEPALVLALRASFIALSGPNEIVLSLIGALVRAICYGYLALVTAKVYSDIAFGRRSW
jgi:hypothetical protein